MYKLNRRVIVRVWKGVADEFGGPGATLVSQYTKWAEVRERSGGIDSSQGRDNWQYDQLFIMRHETTRPTKSNYTIDYEGARYRIDRVTIETEAHNKWDKCYGVMVDENIVTSGDPLPVSNAFMNREDFILSATQTGVTLTALSAMPISQVMSVVLDGYDYPNIISSGTPVEDQVKYNSIGAVLTFPYADANNNRNGYVMYQIPVPS